MTTDKLNQGAAEERAPDKQRKEDGAERGQAHQSPEQKAAGHSTAALAPPPPASGVLAHGLQAGARAPRVGPDIEPMTGLPWEGHALPRMRRPHPRM
jgi:hypothetical protein